MFKKKIILIYNSSGHKLVRVTSCTGVDPLKITLLALFLEGLYTRTYDGTPY